MAERPSIGSIPGDHQVQAAIAAVAGGTADELAVWHNNLGVQVTITEASFLPEAKLTGADTNSAALQFRNKSDTGAGTTAITSVKTYTSGVDIEAFAKDALTLSTTAANLIVEDGETVALNKTEDGSGDDLPAGIAILKFKFK